MREDQSIVWGRYCASLGGELLQVFKVIDWGTALGEAIYPNLNTTFGGDIVPIEREVGINADNPQVVHGAIKYSIHVGQFVGLLLQICIAVGPENRATDRRLGTNCSTQPVATFTHPFMNLDSLGLRGSRGFQMVP